MLHASPACAKKIRELCVELLREGIDARGRLMMPGKCPIHPLTDGAHASVEHCVWIGRVGELAHSRNLVVELLVACCVAFDRIAWALCLSVCLSVCVSVCVSLCLFFLMGRESARANAVRGVRGKDRVVFKVLCWTA